MIPLLLVIVDPKEHQVWFTRGKVEGKMRGSTHLGTVTQNMIKEEFDSVFETQRGVVKG